MAAFYSATELVSGDLLVLEGQEAHHVRVRRYRAGDCIDVIDGCGAGYRARIEDLAPRRVTARVLERLAELGESPVRLHLAAAMLKGSRFDYVVEKATEVGVASITPLLGERVVARPAVGSGRLERWQRLATAAAKQCGRSRVPAVATPLTPAAAACRLRDACDPLLVAGPAQDGDLAAALAGGQPARQTTSVALFVGPEGGFEAGEVEALRQLGARFFSWGARTLRAETAAVVLSALVLDRAERRLSGSDG